MMPCVVVDCPTPRWRGGYCQQHYQEVVVDGGE